MPPSLPEQVDAVAEAVAADGSQEECIVLDDALDALVEIGESFLLVPELESSGPASGEVGIVAPVDLCTDNEAETTAASSGAASLLALREPPQNSATRFFCFETCDDWGRAFELPAGRSAKSDDRGLVCGVHGRGALCCWQP